MTIRNHIERERDRRTGDDNGAALPRKSDGNLIFVFLFFFFFFLVVVTRICLNLNDLKNYKQINKYICILFKFF
jgi:hypothetical protein